MRKRAFRRNAVKVPASLIGASDLRIIKYVKGLSNDHLGKIIKNKAGLKKTAAGKSLVQTAIAQEIIRKMNKKYHS